MIIFELQLFFFLSLVLCKIVKKLFWWKVRPFSFQIIQLNARRVWSLSEFSESSTFTYFGCKWLIKEYMICSLLVSIIENISWSKLIPSSFRLIYALLRIKCYIVILILRGTAYDHIRLHLAIIFYKRTFKPPVLN